MVHLAPPIYPGGFSKFVKLSEDNGIYFSYINSANISTLTVPINVSAARTMHIILTLFLYPFFLLLILCSPTLI